MRRYISPRGALAGGLSASFLVAACSGNALESSQAEAAASSAAQPPSSPNGAGSSLESGASERCGATPRTLVDPAHLFPATLPGESRSLINIEVNTTDIYYAGPS
jgi:hypothetical protein